MIQEENIDEVEEIKEVRGRRYSKMSRLFNVTAQYILEPTMGVTGFRPLKLEPAPHQHLAIVLSYSGLC